jgi:hypothetical protein
VCASDPFPCYLFDNGSLRASATLGLRRLAARLAAEWGGEVRPVSLLHSSGVPREDLDGKAAELLEPALAGHLAAGGEQAVLLPLFFGPSAALTDYVPDRLRALREKYPAARLTLARPLVDIGDPGDTRLAGMLADRVREVARAHAWLRPAVLLVDHGTPQPAVAAVRDHLGRQLSALLGEEVRAVGVASMERRPGADYAFNDPLLIDALAAPGWRDGEVVVAMQFLLPGRHAGPAGDVAQICAAARAQDPRLRTAMTEPLALGEDERLRAILRDRWREALRADSWA